MSEWVNVHTLFAFILGVLLAASVKAMAVQAKSKLGG